MTRPLPRREGAASRAIFRSQNPAIKKRRQTQARQTLKPSWFVYVLDCDRTRLYVGVTTDVQRRYREHLQGGARAARFTRSRHRLTLVYTLEVGDKSLAMRIEYRLKHLPAAQKRRVSRTRMQLAPLLNLLKLDT